QVRLMKIIAHRGASAYTPENTIAAFQKALEQNVDGVELDVRLSKDGIPVISHDASIARTSNGKGYIHNMTVNQLKKFDFGSHFNTPYKNETIPTLEEVLKIFKHSNITIHLELKNGPIIPLDLEEKVVELCTKYNVEENTVYSSFDHVSLKRLVKISPRAKI